MAQGKRAVRLFVCCLLLVDIPNKYKAASADRSAPLAEMTKMAWLDIQCQLSTGKC